MGLRFLLLDGDGEGGRELPDLFEAERGGSVAAAGPHVAHHARAVGAVQASGLRPALAEETKGCGSGAGSLARFIRARAAGLGEGERVPVEFDQGVLSSLRVGSWRLV